MSHRRTPIRTIAAVAALALAALLAGCASRRVPVSAGFAPPTSGPPEGKLSANADAPPAPVRQAAPSTPAPASKPSPAPAHPAAAAPAAAGTAAAGTAAAAGSAAAATPTYVDVLPEAVTKVPPSYPDSARAKGISGTVTVEAYVRADGSVGDTRISKSVPGLDDAAAAAVRQWRFKPATAKGQPVAWWVSVPVKFSLH